MARKKLIQIRRDTAAGWAAANPVLASGEAGLETDTNKLKYGNGSLPWNLLPYFTAEGTPPDLTPYATKVELENHEANHSNPHGVTKAQIGLSNVPNIDFTAAVAANTAKISFDPGSKNKLDGIESGAQVNTVTSVASKTGAVNLDKNDVGLGNVNNTSDANKPISNATQIALNSKQDKLVSGSNIKTVNGNSLVGGGNVNITASVGFGDLTGDPADNIKLNNALGAKAEEANLVSHVNNTSNPHNVTKAQLNLGNVDNTSDANKPISIATQGVLNTKLENITGLVTAGSNVSISGSGTIGSPYVVSSSGGGGGGGDVASVNGKTGTVVLNQDDVGDGTTYKRYSQTEKSKLAGIEASADVTDAANVAAAGAFMKSTDSASDVAYDDTVLSAYGIAGDDTQEVVDNFGTAMVSAVSDLATKTTPNLPTGTTVNATKIPQAWFDSLRASTGVRYVVIVADSFGVFGSNSFPWFTEKGLISLTNTKSDPMPQGWRFAHGGAPIPRWTTNGGTVASTTTTGGYGATMTAGQKGTHTATCDGITVFYRKAASAGSLIVRDGVGGTTLTTINTAGTDGEIGSWTSGSLTSQSRTFEFEASGGTVVVEGSYQTSGNRTDGIRVISASRSGENSQGNVTNQTRSLDLIRYLKSIDQLALVITATGTNDNSTIGWQGQLIDAVKAAVPGTPVVSWIPPINNANPASEYEAMKADVLTRDVEMIDGSMLGRIDGDDAVHPTSFGQAEIAAQIVRVLSGNPLDGGTVGRYKFVPLLGDSTITGALTTTGNITASSGTFSGNLAAQGSVTAQGGNFGMTGLFGLPSFQMKENADTLPEIAMATKTLNSLLGSPASPSIIFNIGDNSRSGNLYLGTTDKTLVTNSDLAMDSDAKGLVLIDRNDAKKYRLYVDSGTLGIEEVV